MLMTSRMQGKIQDFLRGGGGGDSNRPPNYIVIKFKFSYGRNKKLLHVHARPAPEQLVGFARFLPVTYF